MKRIALLCALIISCSLSAQTGYTWVIESMYDDAGVFANGLAVVKKDGKYGAINPAGKEVIPFEYTELNPFTEKVTSFKRGDKVGIIDINGKVLCEKDYEKIYPVSDSCAKVFKGEYGFINAYGKEVVPLAFANLLPFNSGMTYFFKDLKYGFYNTKGEIVVPLSYKDVGAFAEGLCPVAMKDKWGYINTKGKMVIAAEYDEAGKFSEGLASVRKGEKWGFIDKTGKLVIPFKFDVQAEFKEGIIEVYENDPKGNNVATYYNTKGEMLFQLKPGWWVDGKFSDGMIVAANGHYYGYLNTKGEAPFESEYAGAMPFKNGYAAVKSPLGIAIVDKAGKELAGEPLQDAKQYSEGLIPAKVNGKWGYISPTK